MSLQFGLDNIIIGDFANVLAGSKSIVIGKGAISDNIHGIAIGELARAHSDGNYGCIAIGYKALTSNSTTYTAIAIGHEALMTQNTFSGIAIGYQALKMCNTSGCIAIGSQCLMNDTGADNCGFGNFCLTTCSSGTQNCGFGVLSLSNLNTGYNNTCIGHQTGTNITSGFYNTCIGPDANCNATLRDQIAIGRFSIPSNTGSIAIGQFAQAAGTNAVAIGGADVDGQAARSNDNFTVAIGYKSYASDNCATAIGYNAQSTGNTTTAIGSSAAASNTTSVAIGTQTSATGADTSICLGYLANCNATGGIAMCRSAGCSGAHAQGLGLACNCSYTGGVCFGIYTWATNQACVAIGGTGNGVNYGARATGIYAISIGTLSRAWQYCISIGYFTGWLNDNVNAWDNISLGAYANYNLVSGVRNTCIGRSSGMVNVTGSYNVAIGYGSGHITSTSATGTVAIGQDARVSGDYGLAIGAVSRAASRAVAIGYGANATASRVRIGGSPGQYTTAKIGCGAWSYFSDRRIKTDISDLPAELGLDFISNLTPRKYCLKTNNDYKYYGFIAQEFQSSWTNLGYSYDDGILNINDDSDVNQDPYLGLSYDEIFTLHVKSIQELSNKCESLKQRILDIKTQNVATENQIEVITNRNAELNRIITEVLSS